MTESTLAKPPEAIVITQYEVLLDDIKEAVAAAVPSFDYESKQGDKAARSYIFQLRKLRARIDAARKDAKSWALAYGKAVDGQAKSLTEQVDALIAPHQAALDEISAKEAQRVEKHRMVLQRINGLRALPFGATAAVIEARLKELWAIETKGLEEFAETAAADKLAGVEELESARARAAKAEAEAAELARLRAEQAARAEAELREQKAREAQDRADALAQAAAQQAIDAAEARAAQAEAALQSARAETLLAVERGPQRGEVLPPRPVSDAEVELGARAELATVIFNAMAGLDRMGVARAIVNGTLHPSVRVDWSHAVEAGL